MKTTNIKGKEYVMVNERVKEFRKIYQNELSITCEILNFNEQSVLMKAEIKDKDGRVLAVGHAHETANSSMINKTSMFENCETSAIGRALGFLGIGIDASIASADEVSLAIALQEKELTKTAKSAQFASNEAIKIIKELLPKTKTDILNFMAFFKVESINQLTEAQATEAIKMLNAKLAKGANNE